MWIEPKGGTKRQWEIIGFCCLAEHNTVLEREVGLRGRVSWVEFSWVVFENGIEIEINGSPYITIAPDQIIPISLLRR